MMFGEDRPTYDLWAMRPLSDLFDEGELSPQARAVLDHWSGLYAGGPKQSAIVMHAQIINHYMNGAYYPEGGGQMIAARLVQVIEACGGEVRTLSPVDRITIEDGRATGITLENGDEVVAPIVVSNADYRRTIDHLVGHEHVAPGTAAWADEAEMTLGLVCAYVVVDKLIDGPNTNYFVFGDYRTDELYAELDRGQLPDEEVPFAYVAMASRKDPGNAELCPPGHTNFQIMTLSPRGHEFWGVEAGPADGGSYRRNDTYRERRNRSPSGSSASPNRCSARSATTSSTSRRRRRCPTSATRTAPAAPVTATCTHPTRSARTGPPIAPRSTACGSSVPTR